jgi:hypothetical protein
MVIAPRTKRQHLTGGTESTRPLLVGDGVTSEDPARDPAHQQVLRTDECPAPGGILMAARIVTIKVAGDRGAVGERICTQHIPAYTGCRALVESRQVVAGQAGGRARGRRAGHSAWVALAQ